MTTLSICIPTHHGRAATLKEAIESVVGQLTPELRERVEICVSDNASEDETAELMAAYRAVHGDLVVYHRNDRDKGAQYNILKSVEIASGDWCWLLSSDDLIAPNGLSTAIGLLELRPDVAGMSVAWATYERSMEMPSAPPAAFFPSRAAATRVFDGASSILAECGMAQSMLSAQIVSRRLWAEGISDLGGAERVILSSWFSFLYLIGTMIRRQPKWLWCGARLVSLRNSNGVAMVEWGWETSRMSTVFADKQLRALRHVAGPSTPTYRVLLGRVYRASAAPGTIRAFKLLPDQRFRSDVRMLVTYTRLFASLGEFWRRSFPLLLLPHLAMKSIVPLLGTNRPLGDEDRHVSIGAEIRATLRAGQIEEVELTVANRGRGRLASTGSHPVHLAYAWHAADSGSPVITGTMPLPRPLPPQKVRSLVVRLLTPAETGHYVLRVTLVQAGPEGFHEVHPEGALATRVRIESYPAAEMLGGAVASPEAAV